MGTAHRHECERLEAPLMCSPNLSLEQDMLLHHQREGFGRAVVGRRVKRSSTLTPAQLMPSRTPDSFSITIYSAPIVVS